jgi:uncharacterized protein with gpF-like domain
MALRIDIRKDYREQLRLLIRLSKNLKRKISGLFNRYSKRASAEFKDNEEISQEYYLEFSNEFINIMRRHYRVCITEQYERMTRMRTKQEEPLEDVIEAYITLRLGAEISQINNTTRKRIIAVIRNGLLVGDSIPDIANSIEKSSAFSSARATLIARTETHSAMGYGSNEIAKTLNFKRPQKIWNAALDIRTRDWHRQTNGQTKNADEKFEIITPQKGGSSFVALLDYAGDPNGGALNVINCRCFVTHYDDEDEIIDIV